MSKLKRSLMTVSKQINLSQRIQGMIKKPMLNSKPIGRDFEFNNPFANSNKKHYWNYGEGNLGFLTTEQLQTLRRLKFRQVKPHAANHEEYSRSKGNLSARNLNATIIGETAHHSMSQRNLDVSQRIPAISPKVEVEVIEPKQSNKRLLKRYKSELNNYKNQSQEHIENYKVKMRSYMKPAGRESQIYRKLNNSRKIMFQQGQSMQANPQDETKLIHKAFHRSSLQEKSQINLRNLKKRKSQLKLQSGILKLNQRQSILGRSQKFQQKDKFMRIETEPSSQRQHNTGKMQGNKIQPYIKMSELTANQEQNEALYKSRKFIIPRDHFSKFRRDHSPTFCNSIDYPLSYYRHV